QIGMGYDLDLAAPDRVYSHARAFHLHPDFVLGCGVDPNPVHRTLFEERYGCRSFPDVRSASTAGPPDVVVIAAPTDAHVGVLAEVLETLRPSVVLCEKPLAYGLADARAMVRACSERGVDLYVNYMRRSDPGVIEVRRRLEAGEIKGPAKAVGWYSKGFFHNGSHIVNLLEFWLGPLVSGRVIRPGRDWSPTDPEPDAIMELARGAVILLAAREEDYSHYCVELVCPSGRLRYDRGGAVIEWEAVVTDPEYAGYKTLDLVPGVIPSGMERSQWHVADQLSRRLAGLSHHLCSGQEALNTLASMHTILESS
ncbi:MAG: Gfo/Idh/MocA family oxidoreductase, partial [Candidatus Nanopelagicales bacterium]